MDDANDAFDTLTARLHQIDGVLHPLRTIFSEAEGTGVQPLSDSAVANALWAASALVDQAHEAAKLLGEHKFVKPT